MDVALKTQGIKQSNVETWLLFAPPYQNFWLRVCVQPAGRMWRRRRFYAAPFRFSL